jgi:S1-C subfamily serine protease
MGMRRASKGVPVESVVPESPAAAAGVRPGDVIESLDGSSIGDANKLLQVLAKKQPGDTVKLGLLRDRKSLEVQVVLARREALFEER